MSEPTKYIVTDLVDKNTILVDKYDVAEKLTELFDGETKLVQYAVENIEDYMWHRLNGPMWGDDALQLRIEECE